MNPNFWSQTKRLLSFLGLSIVAGVLAFELHELGHFVLGTLAGLDATFAISYVEFNTPDASALQNFIAALGGPMVTFTLAALGLWLATRYERYALPLLALSMSNAWLRIWAMFSSLKGAHTHQDEYLLATILGLPGNVLVVTSLLLGLVLFGLAIRQAQTRIMSAILSVVGTMVGMGVVNVLA